MATKKQQPKKAPAKTATPQHLPPGVVAGYPSLDDTGIRNTLITIGGQPKQGKSTYAMSVLSHADPKSTIIFEVEQGGVFAAFKQVHCWSWLKKHGVTDAIRDELFATQGIKPCLTLEEFEASIDYYLFKPAAADANYSPYKVVIIDSLTELSDLIEERVSPYASTRGEKEIIRAWGEIKVWWSTLFRRLQRLDDCIVILTTHLVDRTVKPLHAKGAATEAGTETENMIVPAISGSSYLLPMRKAFHFFELTRQGFGAQARYSLWTDQNNRLFAGGRLNVELCERDRTLGGILHANGLL